MSRFSRPRLAIAIVLLVAACLTGCSPGVEEPRDELPQKNREQWAMPLDTFSVYSQELDNYAEQLLIGRCLAAVGYEWPVPWQDPQFSPAPDFNRVGLRLFNRQTAQRWGYHFAPARNAAEGQAWYEFTVFANSSDPDSGFNKRFDDCSAQARDEGTIAFTDANNWITSLAIQANDVAEQNPDVVAARDRWQQCLETSVDFAVPDNPWQMPPSPLDESFGISGPQATPSPSAAEIDLAVRDADCQESSGFSAALYSTEWDEQVKLVRANRDELDRVRAEGVKRQKHMLEIVAEHSPAAP
jgi:hypothetical protein